MKKKILSFLLTICLIIPAIFCFSACAKAQEIEFKVADGYIQYFDGKEWIELIAVDDLKGKEGDAGIGVDGREVEFRTTSTHIQWRYVDSKQGQDENWTNLISFEELQANPEDNIEEIKNRGFNLFQEAVSNITDNSSYTLVYDYNGFKEIEYYASFGIDASYVPTGASNVFNFIMQCRKSSIVKTKESGEKYNPYILTLVGRKNVDYVATNSIALSLCKDEWSNTFEIIEGEVNDFSMDDSSIISNFYADLRFLNSFEHNQTLDCMFNESGDCVVSFYYDAPVSFGIYSRDYIYEFCITNQGILKECRVYNKDFLNPKEKGLIHCVVTYNAGNCNVTDDAFNLMLDAVKNGKYNDSDFTTIFGYEKEQ